MPTWPPSHHAPRTVRPLTWPNQRDWSKDTSYRTADLAQVRSATLTCRRTPHHQYGKRGGKRDSTLSYGRPGTGKVGNPHLQAHASPPVQQAWQEARQHGISGRPQQDDLFSTKAPPLQHQNPQADPGVTTHPNQLRSMPKKLRSGRTSAHGPGPAKTCSTYLKAKHVHLASPTKHTISMRFKLLLEVCTGMLRE
ncbi:hypothetical protein BHE74_00059218 [Ensete ventricosum]|nr:hypothetical protein BHE74_00059218 [Ensete ventricosum]